MIDFMFMNHDIELERSGAMAHLKSPFPKSLAAESDEVDSDLARVILGEGTCESTPS